MHSERIRPFRKSRRTSVICSIAPAAGMRRVRYFHVELDAHAVLLAEGAPAESYLEDGNRLQFDNGGLIVALHADFRPAPCLGANAVRGCAPRIGAGARLEVIRLRLKGAAALPVHRSRTG